MRISSNPYKGGKQLDFEDFLNLISEKIISTLGETDYECKLSKVTKNNGTVKNGISIRKKGENISPLIYLEPFYDYYLDGVHMDQIVEHILKSYYYSLDNIKNEDLSFFQMDFESCKDKIIFRLVSKEKNKHLLDSIPYLEILDWILFFAVVKHSDRKSVESIRINNAMLEYWDVSFSEIISLATKNTERIFPLVLRTLTDVINEQIPGTNLSYEMNQNRMNIYVISNHQCLNGASVIAYKDTLEQVYKHINTNFYVIPSSIHEMLIIPDDSYVDKNELKNLVEEVNETVVLEEDFLSNNIYFYDRNDKELTIVN